MAIRAMRLVDREGNPLDEFLTWSFEFGQQTDPPWDGQDKHATVISLLKALAVDRQAATANLARMVELQEETVALLRQLAGATPTPPGVPPTTPPDKKP